MKPHVSAAPVMARTTGKKNGLYRSRLHQASKAQERGDAKAADEIKQIIREMQSDHIAVQKALNDTKGYAYVCDLGLLALKTGTLPKNKQKHPIIRCVRKCLLFGVRGDAQLQLLDHLRQRADGAIEKAERRLDDNSNDTDTTAALAQLVTKLPDVDFKTNHPDVRQIRQRNNNLMNEVRKRA